MPTTLFQPSLRLLRKHALRAALALSAALALGSLPAQAAPAKGRAPATNQVLAECSWDRPGHNKFSGDVPTAIDRYEDIPAAVRSRLKQRMTVRDYDDMVSIRRDRIAGKRDYDGEIRDMYFGAGNICRTVTRAGWNAEMHERGMVYCDSGHCILVPTVCRNVSRIVRRDVVAPVATAPQGIGAGQGELPFDPPGAGMAAPSDGATGPLGRGGSGGTFASQSGIGTATGPWFAGLGPGTGAGAGTGIGMGMGMVQGGHAGPTLEGAATDLRNDHAVPGIGWPEALLTKPEIDAAFPAPTAAVPEPQAWLMLAAGLVLVGAFTRRRRCGGHLPKGR